MPIIYFHQSDEDQFPAPPPPSVPLDEDDGWWVGTQKCGATVALAASLAVSSFSARVAQAVQQNGQQDDLTWHLDEDYWQGYGVLTWKSSSPKVFSDDELIVPQPVVFQPDEDYWSPYLPTWTFPVQRKAFSDEDVLPALSVDEDYYWQGLMINVWPFLYFRLPYFYDPSEESFISSGGQYEDHLFFDLPTSSNLGVSSSPSIGGGF